GAQLAVEPPQLGGPERRHHADERDPAGELPGQAVVEPPLEAPRYPTDDAPLAVARTDRVDETLEDGAQHRLVVARRHAHQVVVADAAGDLDVVDLVLLEHAADAHHVADAAEQLAVLHFAQPFLVAVDL